MGVVDPKTASIGENNTDLGFFERANGGCVPADDGVQCRGPVPRSRTTESLRLPGASGSFANNGSVAALPATRAMRVSGMPNSSKVRRAALARSADSSQLE